MSKKLLKRTPPLHIRYPLLFIYCLSTALSTFLLFFLFASSNGTLIPRWFFHDTMDTGMDFFHSIEYLEGNSPYLKFGTLYPPLANLFYKVLLRFVPATESALWEPSFGGSISMRGSALDLRVHQAPLLLFIAFSLVVCLLTLELLTYMLREHGIPAAKCAAFSALFSYGFLWGLERGNLILLVLPLCLFFVLFRRHANPFLKESALLALAVAAGFKLYPAFLGILLIIDKDWKAAARTVLYGVASLVLPFFAYQDGLEGVIVWVKKVLTFSAPSRPEWAGIGFSSILWHGADWLERHFGLSLEWHFFSLFGYLAAALLLLCAMCLDTEWERVLAITLAMLLYSPQEDYSLVLFLLPLFSLLSQQQRLTRRVAVPFVCLLALVLPLPLFYTRAEYYPHSTLTQCAMLALFIWVCVQAFCPAAFRQSGNPSVIEWCFDIFCTLFHLNDQQKNTLIQFIKFGLVGVSNTVVSMVCYYLFLWIDPALYLLGSFVGTVVSIANAFFWNDRFVFAGGSKDVKSTLRRLGKTYISYGGTSLLSIVMLWVEVNLFSVNKSLAPIVNLLITIPLNFVINKLWTFRK